MDVRAEENEGHGRRGRQSQCLFYRTQSKLQPIGLLAEDNYEGNTSPEAETAMRLDSILWGLINLKKMLFALGVTRLFASVIAGFGGSATYDNDSSLFAWVRIGTPVSLMSVSTTSADV